MPNDAKFEDVRIHSFGYTSKLGGESILNINDFAKALLGAIYDCPLIPSDSDVGSFTYDLPNHILVAWEICLTGG